MSQNETSHDEQNQKEGNGKGRTGLNKLLIIVVSIVALILVVVIIGATKKGTNDVEEINDIGINQGQEYDKGDDDTQKDIGKVEEDGDEDTNLNHENYVDDAEDPSQVDIGHLGGDELLIEEDPKGVTDIEGFYEKVEDGEDFYVWFYSPYCSFCHDMHDTIYDKFEEYDVNYIALNVNQKKGFQEEQGIESVPMVAHYKDGKQVSFVIGDREDKVFDDFFKDDKTTGLEQ